MSRPLVLGNGNVVVCIDKYAQIKNFYYPYPGKEDHVKGHHHKIGVWVEGSFSWTTAPGWNISIKYKKNSLVGETFLTNNSLGVELVINDIVHPEKNIFLKKIKVKNLSNQKKNVRLFLNQHFNIAGENIGDTVFFHPYTNSLVSYQGKRYFLINGFYKKQGFFQYATGAAREGSKEGTFRDAENGWLSGNPIEHGSVDSTVSFDLNLFPGKEETLFFWITIGKNLEEVKTLNRFTLRKTPNQLLLDTEKYWLKWIKRINLDFLNLDKSIVDLFKKSLLIIKTHTSPNGAIIASLDTESMGLKKDNYSYMWPRDGAMISRALDKTGYTEITDAFFNFCKDVISKDGFLYHKYLPDKSIGSSWHPWLKGDKIQLPIQEDETALILRSLWKGYKQNKRRKMLKELYAPLIRKAANFLVDFRDKSTNLPKESYNLWEDKLGVHTFTSCTVYAGLMSAHYFAKEMNKVRDAGKYLKAAKEVKEAILKYLYDRDKGIFVNRIYQDEKGKWNIDHTADISTVYGLFKYRVLDVHDERLTRTMETVLSKLSCPHHSKGFLRFENDNYFRINNSYSGNPWFIASHWVAEYYIIKAKKLDDLKPALEIFDWTVKHALPSGILSEQLDPFTGNSLSYTPLMWSHASFVVAVIEYLKKKKELERNKRTRKRV
ncbi:glycoside hydrolase family 15 protein [Patescibacteria group bacterium]|nr:glycoside hydrolase family 15 protein [Patescibacteria group bacterium]